MSGKHREGHDLRICFSLADKWCFDATVRYAFTHVISDGVALLVHRFAFIVVCTRVQQEIRVVKVSHTDTGTQDLFMVFDPRVSAQTFS